MENIRLTKEVKLFNDDDQTCKQEVLIDPNDVCGPWIVVVHSGNELSLSMDNWNELVALVNEAKEIYIKNNN